MNEWIVFFVAALATHRLTVLLTKDDGPGWIIDKVRRLPSKSSSAWQGIRCIRCVSMWMAGLTILLLAIETHWGFVVVLGLALSDGAIIIERMTNKDG